MPRYVIERDIPDIGTAERSGFPATIVTAVSKMIGPVTAEP